MLSLPIYFLAVSSLKAKTKQGLHLTIRGVFELKLLIRPPKRTAYRYLPNSIFRSSSPPHHLLPPSPPHYSKPPPQKKEITLLIHHLYPIRVKIFWPISFRSGGNVSRSLIIITACRAVLFIPSLKIICQHGKKIIPGSTCYKFSRSISRLGVSLG